MRLSAWSPWECGRHARMPRQSFKTADPSGYPRERRMGRPPFQCYGPYIRSSADRGNPCDYSRVYWCTCTLSSNPVHVAYVTGDAAPGLRGPGNGVNPTPKGEAARIKPPTGNSQGQPIQAAAPFPRKDVSAPCRSRFPGSRTYPLSRAFPRSRASVALVALWVLVSDFDTRHPFPV